jgi:hypothetical protein
MGPSEHGLDRQPLGGLLSRILHEEAVSAVRNTRSNPFG